jgi:hypothetical protein
MRELRASDSDRERTVARLRDHHAEGRLSLEELEERVERAYAARSVGDLRALTRDLPVSRSARRRWKARARRRAFQAHAATYGVVNTGLVAAWADDGGFFWPGIVLVSWGAGLARDGWRTRKVTRAALPPGGSAVARRG